MKPFIILLTLFILQNCSAKEYSKSKIAHSFYVGTYTDSESKGIYKYSLAEDGTLRQVSLAAQSENPSYLAISHDKRYVIAINEIKNESGTGTVESYLIKQDTLELISGSSSGGAHPCFVAVNENGFILTANYTGGNVGLLRLGINGVLSELLDVKQHTGHGISERQKSPRAHSAWFGLRSNNVISVDLGTNELWFSELDTTLQKLIPLDPQKLKMKPGAGPRHLALHPNGKWIYVVNEIDCTVTLVSHNENDGYKIGPSIGTLPSAYIEPNTCADIHISADGKFVYASNRGHNSLVIYEVNEASGSLSILGHQTTQGNGPRNFALSPDENYILVANQKTNNIVSFRRDKLSGMLTFTNEVYAPVPVCILFN